MVRYEDENKTPVTPEQIITPRRREDKQNDLWTTWQRVQENMIKGGLPGKSASGKNTRTRAITGIDGDILLLSIKYPQRRDALLLVFVISDKLL